MRAAATIGAAAVLSAVILAPAAPAQADPITILATVACDPDGATAADATLAGKLNSRLQSDMRGNMTSYTTSCARVVVNAVKARGLESRAAVIAIATVIVETHLQNRSDVVDHTSIGLYQQQDGWGTREQRLDPVWATNAFLNKMVRVYPNDSWKTAPTGEVCQAVQVSAFPDKYQEQAADAQIIVNALWNGRGSRNDFDGDGVDDIGLYRHSNGQWHIKSVKKNDVLYGSYPYGGNDSDIPLAGDFDGDGVSDIALYRHSNGQWHIKSVKKNDVLYGSYPYGGQESDIPLVGDFDGDGFDDIALYRKSSGQWHIKSVKKNVVLYGSYPYGGQESDMPIVGDFDGDGVDDIALYRHSNGQWHIKSVKKNDVLYGSYPYGGQESDIPQVGDFDGDGVDDIALYRHSNGQWHIKSVKKNDVLYGSYPYGGQESDIPVNK